MTVTVPVCALGGNYSAASRVIADIAAILRGLQDAAAAVHGRLEPLAERAWLRAADAVVDNCVVILDNLPRLLQIARACPDNVPVPHGHGDMAEWRRIDALLTEIAALVPRLEEPGVWGTCVVAMLRQRIRYNLELLYGWRRMPEVYDSEETVEVAHRPASTTTAPASA
jgi:hypothetical protein